MPRRVAVVVVLLAAVQLAAFLVYRLVEQRRGQQTSTGFAYERLTRETTRPGAVLQAPDASTVGLDGFRGRPVLVHFWATWCAPCRDELPELIELGNDTDLPLLLVSLDNDWAVVRHFFDGKIPPGTVLDRGGSARRAFGVSTLPDTYLLDALGRPTARFHGPRHWSSPGARAQLSELVGQSDEPRD